MNIKAVAEAFMIGAKKAEENLGEGKVFLGAFGVADQAGYRRNTPEWESAVSGALSVFKTRKILIDTNGVQGQ